jgi:hypothetical protein
MTLRPHPTLAPGEDDVGSNMGIEPVGLMIRARPWRNYVPHMTIEQRDASFHENIFDSVNNNKIPIKQVSKIILMSFCNS